MPFPITNSCSMRFKFGSKGVVFKSCLVVRFVPCIMLVNWINNRATLMRLSCEVSRASDTALINEHVYILRICNAVILLKAVIGNPNKVKSRALAHYKRILYGVLCHYTHGITRYLCAVWTLIRTNRIKIEKEKNGRPITMSVSLLCVGGDWRPSGVCVINGWWCAWK